MSAPTKRRKNKSKEESPPKQADVLLEIGRRHDLFHAPNGDAFARVGNAVFAIESATYREHLAREYFEVMESGCNRNALGDAVTTLASIAKFRGSQRKVWLRTGYADDGDDGDDETDGLHIVIDPGRPDWNMIEVTGTGIGPCRNPPMFRRTKAMQALPEPKSPDFGRLWKYLNVAEEHRVLVAAWMLAALRPSGPYTILFLSGEQGTGKSTAARVLRRLIDPSASDLRPPPKEVRDVLVGAMNGWVLALDNLSSLGPELSDTLCRLATGGAIGERALYTNTEEVLIEVQRPCVMNGIEDLASRPDLVERGLHIELELIEHRRAESEFWQAFNADAPHIFGGLLHGLAEAIRGHRSVRLDRLPRMADFGQWACAGLPAMGFTAAEFMAAYTENLQRGMRIGVDSSPVGRLLAAFVWDRGEWEGTASSLISELSNRADDMTLRSPQWPKSPNKLSGVIRRLAPAMRTQGIRVEQDRKPGGNRERIIRLCSDPHLSSQASLSSRDPQFRDGRDDRDDEIGELHNALVTTGGAWEAAL